MRTTTGGYPVDSRISNYGMGRTTAMAYNQGIHVVGSEKHAEQGPGGSHPHGSAHAEGVTHYATDPLALY